MSRHRTVKSDKAHDLRRKSQISSDSFDLHSQFALLRKLDTKVDDHHRRNRTMFFIAALIVMVTEIVSVITKLIK